MEIIWGILGAIGVALLGFLGWGVKKLIVTTFNNTTQIALLNQTIGVLVKDIDGVAAVVGTARSRGQKITIEKGEDYED